MRTVTVLFEAHATSVDNEARRASGWHDADLSSAGERQARELGDRYRSADLAAVFCSDLRRSWRTAELAFGTDAPIIRDPRLRECNFGLLNQAPTAEVNAAKREALDRPYPAGESYRDAARRMRAFLRSLFPRYSGRTVLVIGHRATQYGLEHYAAGVPLATAVVAPWAWQPGWRYDIDPDPISDPEPTTWTGAP